MVENRPIIHNFRARKLSSYRLLTVFTNTQPINEIIYETVYYFLCFGVLKQRKERNGVPYTEFNLELLYKHRLGVDEIHMQKAKCLARGIKSKNESNAKFIVEVIVRQRELLSESGSVPDNFLREGGKKNIFSLKFYEKVYKKY